MLLILLKNVVNIIHSGLCDLCREHKSQYVLVKNCMTRKFIKVAPYYFLKSEKMANFNLKKETINISEKNETKTMHRITFRASNSVNG